MRSELVYCAGLRVPNRYLLSILAIKAVRKLHATSTRIEETTNRVFSDFANGDCLEIKVPEVKPVQDVDNALTSPFI